MSPAPATLAASFNGFQGLADNFRSIPPDTVGAVGPQHVVSMLNTQMLIQSRSGSIRQNYPIALSAFWSPLGSFPDVFDPRILYDTQADRWIAAAAANSQSAGSALLVAVSRTADPGGDWNYFKVNVGAANQWGDFPVLGFNGNWIVVSMNLFQIRGSDYIDTTLFVFSKPDLYQNAKGDYTTFTDSEGELTPVRDYDGRDANTFYMVQAFAGEFSPVANAGAIRISKLSGPTGVETFRGGNVGTIVVTDPWSDSAPGEVDFGPQPGSTVAVDTGDSRLVNCALRNATIWCSHTVYVPFGKPTRAAAQWFQFDPAATPPALVQRGRIEDPANTYFYAYPSIAVNRNNDAVVGFTRFSTKDYPSAAFAFRLASDPLNSMQPEVLVKAGEAAYISPGTRSGSNRWGDYSATMVDPVNDLNFWTIQEYAGTPPSGRSGAFGTWWTQIQAPSAGQSCTYSVSATKIAIDSGGGSGTIAVTAPAGCQWQAASNVQWLTIAAGSAGSGPGVVAYAAAQSTASRAGTLSIAGATVTVTQGAPVSTTAPVFTAAGVVNAASFAAGPIAPGELITIYGTNLGPPSLQTVALTAGGTLPSLLGSTRVLFDGIPAPILYTSGGQVAAIVPFALQGRATTQVQVEFQGARSQPVSLAVVSAAPAIFCANSSGKGQGSVLNEDYSLNSATAPAARGSTIMIYATGGGAMTPAPMDGYLATEPLPQIAGVNVRIAGVTAPVAYAGAAPGIVNGVLQINVTIPANVAPGAAVPIDLTIGGIRGLAGVTIAVR